MAGCMDRFVIISGCSGGGKSTLLSELTYRGYATVEEPGLRIVREETASGGTALPWQDMEAFLRRAIALSLADLNAASKFSGWVFFDRGLIDAVSGLQQLTGESELLESLNSEQRFHRRVFLVPPWPEIYQSHGERRHSFDFAIEEYARLSEVYPSLGYEVTILPKFGVVERADFILNILNGA
jgi:predicted ATPase